MRWNKTKYGYPTHEEPVWVSNGKDISAALAVWTECDEQAGWLWEGLDMYANALNSVESYILDDEYTFKYWQDMQDTPE